MPIWRSSRSLHHILHPFTSTRPVLSCRLHHSRLHTTQAAQTPVVTRFAPSPTGDLHIGGLRTALYNYLFAKHHHGQYILRIEDTDTKRYVKGAAEQLVDVLQTCGIQHDNADNVPHQSQRLDIYHQHIDTLLERDAVYPCFCTEQRLTELKEQQSKAGVQPQYDRLCASIPYEQSRKQLAEYKASKQPYVIRLRVPTSTGSVSVRDMCRGRIAYPYKQIDDQVLIKSDGYPTYHFAVVVDDHTMNISHVIRGEEWLTSTPKHILLYNAFKWSVPKYAHLPLLLNPDGTKLSKRHSDVSAQSYLQRGYLPQALINFIAKLSWNTGDNRELMSVSEMCETFDIKRVQKGGAVVSINKLNWYNQQYIRQSVDSDVHQMVARLKPAFIQAYGEAAAGDDAYLIRVVQCLKEHVTLLHDFITHGVYLFTDIDYGTAEAVDMHDAVYSDRSSVRPHTIAQSTIDALQQLSNDQAAQVDVQTELMASTAKQLNAPAKQFYMTLRYMLTGRNTGPHLNSILATLGKGKTIDRLQPFTVQDK